MKLQEKRENEPKTTGFKVLGSQILEDVKSNPPVKLLLHIDVPFDKPGPLTGSRNNTTNINRLEEGSNCR
jgi:hypothetical protein